MRLDVRRIATFIDEERALPAGEMPLRKVAVVGVVRNPYAGRGHVEDLAPLIAASGDLGREICALAAAAMRPYAVQSYGKAALIGTAGEQEHGVALLTTVYGDVMREAVGGGKAWISSMTKRAAPGATLDIPLAFKDALYVRSHYDGMTITLHDAPMRDEIAIVCCFANRGRLAARVGGLRIDQVKGDDGLR